VLTNVDFRDLGDIVKADKVKVVACDGKGSVFQRASKKCYNNYS